MSENELAREGLNEERSARLVRRFGHDLRNNLNAVEMDACHLDLLVEDPEAKEALQRMRKQLSEVERRLRALTIRFISPVPANFPAADLFTMWNSRAMGLLPGVSILWENGLGPELICGDLRVIADALGEMLAFYKTPPAVAKAEVKDGMVEFRLEWEFSEESGERKNGVPLPEFAHVIGRNGGSFVETESDSSVACVCRFPVK